MNLGDRVRNGIKWMLVGSLGHRLMEFAFGVVLARLLLPEDFGKVITLQIVTGLVGAIASGGMGQSLVRSKEADEREFDVVFSMQLGLGVLTYIALFLFAPHFARFFDDPSYIGLMQVSAVVFILRPLALIRTSWLRREMRFREISLVTVLTAFATGISGAALAWAGFGIWSLIYSGLIAAAVRNLALAWFTPLRLRLSFDTTIMRKHSGYGFKVTILDLISSMKDRVVALILSKFAGPAALGLFNKGDSLSHLPAHVLVPPVGQTAFRALAIIQDDLDQSKYLFYKIVSTLFLFVAPFFIVLWWIAEPFVGFVYGEKWLPSVGPLQIMSLAGFFILLGIPCGVYLKAHDKLVEQIIGQTLNIVVIAVCVYLGLDWGIEGAAWGLFCANVFGAVYYYWLVYRILPTRLADLARAIAPGLLLNAALFACLGVLDALLVDSGWTHPVIYATLMSAVGLGAYLLAFLFVPIPGVADEARRWRSSIAGAWQGLATRFS